MSNAPVGPKSGPRGWSDQIHQQVLEMRRVRSQRDKQPYALIGAQAIHYELAALKSEEVPPVRTIHDWLVKADLVKANSTVGEKKKAKAIPLPVADQVNRVQQLDLKGPIYLRGSGDKYYLIVLRDRFSRRCAIGVVCNRQAQGIVDFLVDRWRWLGLPDYLQIDNALEFRGANRYPRSFGRVVRVALDLGVEPIFNPPGEPWRNGCVERFNRFIDQHLLSIECADLQALKDQAHCCQQTVNATHRLEALAGLTPDQVAAQAALRFPPPNYCRHQADALSQDTGFVSFVRLVRQSGRITLGAGDRFMVEPDLAYTYVLARVDLARQTVSIFQDQQLIIVYDFSLIPLAFGLLSIILIRPLIRSLIALMYRYLLHFSPLTNYVSLILAPNTYVLRNTKHETRNTFHLRLPEELQPAPAPCAIGQVMLPVAMRPEPGCVTIPPRRAGCVQPARPAAAGANSPVAALSLIEANDIAGAVFAQIAAGL